MTTTIAIIMTVLVLTIAGLAVHVWNLSNDNDKLRADISRNFYEEQMKQYTRYRKTVTFINIENAGDNATLNQKVQQLQDDGWKYAPSASQCPTILCFEKLEPIKEEKMDGLLGKALEKKVTETFHVGDK